MCYRDLASLQLQLQLSDRYSSTSPMSDPAHAYLVISSPICGESHASHGVDRSILPATTTITIFPSLTLSNHSSQTAADTAYKGKLVVL